MHILHIIYIRKLMWLITSLHGAAGVLRGEVPRNVLHPGGEHHRRALGIVLR